MCDMKCPFCGEEMREGALQTKEPSRVDLHAYQWLPPAAEDEPDPLSWTPQPVKDLLRMAPKSAQDLLDRAERRWKTETWDKEKAVPMSPVLGKRGLSDSLLSGNVYFENAWYCPMCEKVLCLFEREKEWLPQSTDTDQAGDRSPASPEREPEKPAPHPPPPDPAPPSRRPGPRDDPWEKRGLFGRRKKPDWEK